MKLKIIALILLIGFIGYHQSPIFVASSIQTAANELQIVPTRIGRFVRTEKQWKIIRDDGVIEEGAMYSDDAHGSKTLDGAPVQLDFYRAYNKPHNGLLCYIGQGERLLWTRHFILQNPNQSIRFLIGLTESDGQLRLTAATECDSDHCDEESFDKEWHFRRPSAHQRSIEGIVPMSVVIIQPTAGANPVQVERELIEKMNSFLDAFDFDPIFALARSQSIK